MEGRKKMEEFYRKLKVGMKLKYAFTTVIVTFAVAMVVSLVSIVMMNVDTYKFYREAYANSTLQMEIRKDIQLVGKYILWSMTTDDTGSTQSYLNSAQKYADQVGKNVTTLKKSFHDKKKVAELKDAIEELKKQRVALMELAQQNKNDEALALFNSDYNDATEKLQDILVDMGKVASAEAKSQYTSARVTGIVSIILMILIGTGAVAFSTVIRTTITGIMLKPIQELEGAAEKLKAGQLDVEINYESPDELGKLAGNFRQAVGLVRKLHGGGNIPLFHAFNPLRNVVMQRTGPFTNAVLAARQAALRLAVGLPGAERQINFAKIGLTRLGG